MLRLFSYILFSFLMVLTAFAQPEILWSHNYGGDHNQECHGAVVSYDGGFALAGTDDCCWQETRSDFRIILINSEGETQWSHRVGGPRDEFGSWVIQASDSSYIIGGRGSSFTEGSCDAWVVKYSADGDSIWSGNYGGRGFDDSHAASPTPDGGFVFGGTTDSQSYGRHGAQDFWLVKVDEDGEMDWYGVYGGRATDDCFDMTGTEDGGYALAGITSSFGPGGRNFYLVKTNDRGEEEWSFAYGTESPDGCSAVVQTTDGGYALAGYTNHFNDGRGEFYLVRIDENGEQLWARHYGGQREECCYSMIQTEDGGFLLSGYTNSFEDGIITMYIVRTNRDGEILWTMTPDRNADYCYDALSTDDGGYAFAGCGYTEIGRLGREFFLVKTGTDILRWISLQDTGFIKDSSLVYNTEYFNVQGFCSCFFNR